MAFEIKSEAAKGVPSPNSGAKIMAKPQFYRPPPTWQIWAAFGGALVIMSISVVLAGIHPEEPPPADVSQIPEAVSAILETEPAPPEPTPPPEEPDIPPPPPPPEAVPEFREEQPTPPPQPNAQRQSHRSADSPGQFRRCRARYRFPGPRSPQFSVRDRNIPMRHARENRPVAASASYGGCREWQCNGRRDGAKHRQPDSG